MNNRQHTKMNETLRIDEAEAHRESPALLRPTPQAKVHFWVGATERPEFLRQTRLMAEAWNTQPGGVLETYDPGENHFTVINALADHNSPLVRTVLA